MKTRLLLMCAFVTVAFSSNAQWRQQYTKMAGTSTYVDHISVIDSNTAWVRGANGSGSTPIKAHARTNDGGETWVAGTFNGMPATVYGRVIEATSYTNAFAIAMVEPSGNASFWKTIDGGANWSLVTGVMNDGSNTFANSVKFWDTSKGYCMGDPVGGKFDIYYTTDGGTTWTPTLAANTPAPVSGEYGYNGFECAAKAPNGVGGFITNKGRVYKTTNYGVNWDTTAVAPFISCPANQIYMSDANNIIVANLTYTPTDTLFVWKKTTDGGATWADFTPVSGTFHPGQMAYVPGTANMFVSTSAKDPNGIGFSNDGGLNWTDYTDELFLQYLDQNSTPINHQMLGVAFADTNNGWVGNFSIDKQNTILRYQKNNSSLFSFVAYVRDTTINNVDIPMGTITGTSNGSYANNTAINVVATANPGYVFVGWFSLPDYSALSQDNSYIGSLTSNQMIIAYFTRDLTYAVAENDFGKVSVSPNPASNNVTIVLDSKQTGLFNVNIVDVTGKIVYTNSLEANSTMNVDVTAFAKGVYFVKINNDKTQFVQKLIVK